MEVSRKTVTGDLYQILKRLFVWETEYGNFVFEGESAQHPRGIVRPHNLHDNEKKLAVSDYNYPLYISSDEVLIPNLSQGYFDTPMSGNIYILTDEEVAFYLGGAETTKPQKITADGEEIRLWEFNSFQLEPWRHAEVSMSHIQDDSLMELFEENEVLSAVMGT